MEVAGRVTEEQFPSPFLNICQAWRPRGKCPTTPFFLPSREQRAGMAIKPGLRIDPGKCRFHFLSQQAVVEGHRYKGKDGVTGLGGLSWPQAGKRDQRHPLWEGFLQSTQESMA